MITISIITPEVHLGIVNEVLDNNNFECKFLKYTYKQLSDINGIYEECKNKCDQIFFTGELGYHYFINTIKDVTLPCSFVFYEEKHILDMLLNFVIEHPNIPLNRVYIDFLTPLNNYMNMKNYLPSSSMPYFYDAYDLNYNHLITSCLNLIKNDKIDIVLTRSTNNLKAFDKYGIPYIHILPTKRMIHESIDSSLANLKLSIKPHLFNITITIKMILEEDLDINHLEYYQITFHKYLVDFRKNMSINFTITVTGDRFEISTTSDFIENDLSIIKDLINYINSFGEINFRLGVGMNESLDTSRFYAETALQEAIKYDKNDGFLMYGNDPILRGPLSKSDTLSYSISNPKAHKYSEEKGIKESNILRIIGIFKHNSNIIITSSLLSQWLNITQRSCNRIISQLLESKVIQELMPLNEGRKGRPVKQYTFVIDNFKKTFL